MESKVTNGKYTIINPKCRFDRDARTENQNL